MKRDLLSLNHLEKKDIEQILLQAVLMKNDREYAMALLNGKSIGLVFQKPSNRTRVSFEVGVHQMGGQCVYLGPDEINLGVRETTADVAKTLTRYLDGIVARTFKHEDIEILAKNSTIPIINGLSDLYHPCQALTDIFSIKEKFHQFDGLTVAFIGDGNNVCHSLMLACAKVGMNFHVATPPNYEPDKNIIAYAEQCAEISKSRILITHSAQEAVKSAHVIYADVWVSMGQEEEYRQRLLDFDGYQINKKLLQLADPDYIFMHCLPAHREKEVTAEIIDGPQSIVFDQAENRLHTQKAILNYIYSTWG